MSIVPEQAAKAALLAALDPEDEKLVEVVARALCEHHAQMMKTISSEEYWLTGAHVFRDDARAAIAALRAMAQGGQ